MLLVPILAVLVLAGALFGLGWNASSRALHPGCSSYTWDRADYPKLSADEVVVESSTGAQLSGRLYAGRTPATVVLLHGYGGNQDEVLPLADQLHQAGFTVFSYDQRGCGASTGEITFGAREQDDLISVVDYLSSRPDIDREQLGVFGFSMGGATAIMAAAREPRLKAVAADSAWSDVRAWLQPSVKDSFVHPRDPFSALSLKLAERRAGIDLDELAPVAVVGQISPRRILLIHGRADEVIQVSEAERNQNAARDPKELVLVSGAGHADTIAPGGASLRHVRDFFERTLARRAKVAA
jgi:pimeloyl-ACP methyl ester carboxylesterase